MRCMKQWEYTIILLTSCAFSLCIHMISDQMSGPFLDGKRNHGTNPHNPMTSVLTPETVVVISGISGHPTCTCPWQVLKRIFTQKGGYAISLRWIFLRILYAPKNSHGAWKNTLWEKRKEIYKRITNFRWFKLFVFRWGELKEETKNTI